MAEPQNLQPHSAQTIGSESLETDSGQSLAPPQFKFAGNTDSNDDSNVGSNKAGTLKAPPFELKAGAAQLKDDTGDKATKEASVSSNTASSNIALIRAEWNALGDKDNRKLAYILATVEGECGFHSGQEKKQVKDNTAEQKDLIRRQSKYWPSGYYGRGFVQITWEDNYRKMSSVVGKDLLKEPDLALEPKIAAKISVYGMINGTFSGAKMSDYINEEGTDYVGARRVINVQERAQYFAELAEAHYARLTAADGGKEYYETFMNLFDIQTVLKDEGLLKGNVDGKGGGDTNQAILAFKTKYKLPNPKSAKIDEATKAKLLELQNLRLSIKPETEVSESSKFDPDKFWNDHGANSKDVAKAATAILPSQATNVLALLNYLYWSNDDVSFYITSSLDINTLKSLPKELLDYMYACMDGGWTVGAEYEAMGKIDLARDGQAADQKAKGKGTGKEQPREGAAKAANADAPKETAESIYNSAKGSYPKLGALLAKRITASPQLIKEMFAYVSYLNTDDLAYYITLQASDSDLAVADKPLISTMYEALDGDWTTPDEYKMMAKLKPYYTGEKDKQTQASQEGAAPSGKDLFVVKDAQAYLRDDKFEKLPGDKTVPKWSKVIVEKTAMSGNSSYSYVVSPDGKNKWGWTATSNLYSVSWTAKGDEKALRAVSSSYYDMMAANDPTVTRSKTQLSGEAAVSQVNAFYPNQNDPKYLDIAFKAKLDVMLTEWRKVGIIATANAGLRHPLRSVVFNYCLAIAANATEDKIHEANAVCTKYGIPVDWAHKKTDGTIDLAASKKGAAAMKSSFGLNLKAARGVTDFGGKISNHNHGKAVDLHLEFTFSETTEVEVNGHKYQITPSKETPKEIPDIQNTPLSKMGATEFGITRALYDDTMHWSENGK